VGGKVKELDEPRLVTKVKVHITGSPPGNMQKFWSRGSEAEPTSSAAAEVSLLMHATRTTPFTARSLRELDSKSGSRKGLLTGSLRRGKKILVRQR